MCAFAAAGSACGGASASASAPGVSSVPDTRPRHFQVVPALHDDRRRAVLARFAERNGAGWEDVTKQGVETVDAIRGIMLSAKRTGPSGPALASPEAIAAEASAFVARNADLLGLAPAEAAALQVKGATVDGKQGFLFTAKLPMRGYESFDSLAQIVTVAVIAGLDGRPESMLNTSKGHPRLSIDTTPSLAPDDPKVVAHIVGRELQVAFDDPLHPHSPVRELRREPIGAVAAKEITRAKLIVRVSPGPWRSYMSYALAYEVHVEHPFEEGIAMFKFIVDADTGELLDDFALPIVGDDSSE